MLAAIISLAGPPPCRGQWQQLSQQDLRSFTEKALTNRLVTVSPPVIRREWVNQRSRVLIIEFGDYSPREFIDDPVVQAALDAQFQVTIFRTYRNKPNWRRYWAPTLAAIENKIQDMLNVAAAPWSDEQKSIMLGQLEEDINDLYDRHFDRWANDERLAGWRIQYGAINQYDVRLQAVPEGTVSYMPAGPWELYVFLTKTKKLRDIPQPRWETPQTRDTTLGGKYWFAVTFDTLPKRHVFGPVLISQPGTLVITPNGIRQ